MRTRHRNRTFDRLMSKNRHPAGKKTDKRVQRTRDRLGDALVKMIHEKPFDTITVEDILKSARVARSTFYTHYRDKNDLFLSDAEDFFEEIALVLSRHRDPSERIAPVRELFAHIVKWRPFCTALVSAGRSHDMVELGEGHFAVGIERRLAELPRAGDIPSDQRAAVAKALAGALFSLLSWWMHRGLRESPASMDELYHRLVWNGCRWTNLRKLQLAS
jgi:AcrR family transcriptional regulator